MRVSFRAVLLSTTSAKGGSGPNVPLDLPCECEICEKRIKREVIQGVLMIVEFSKHPH
jgi:hypothetical protein